MSEDKKDTALTIIDGGKKVKARGYRKPTVQERFELRAMHSYKRSDGSEHERKFINRFLLSIEAMCCDSVGNYYIEVLKPDGSKPTVLFSAHTDDVSSATGRRRVICKDDMFFLPADSQATCLGADNAAGCWMLLELMRAGVPGLYVWHRGEECGAAGSRAFSRRSELIGHIKSAVAFDRRGYHSIITRQRGSEGCSKAYGEALALQLGLGHELDPTGLFTDTASYMDVVPECTNISAGFVNEHSSNEMLDIGYLCALRDAAIKCNWEGLPIVRTPVKEVSYSFCGGTTYTSKWATWKSNKSKKSKYKKIKGGKPEPQPDIEADKEWVRGFLADEFPVSILDIVKQYPAAVADVLEQCGYTAHQLEKEVFDALGLIEGGFYRG